MWLLHSHDYGLVAISTVVIGFVIPGDQSDGRGEQSGLPNIEPRPSQPVLSDTWRFAVIPLAMLCIAHRCAR
jgi:hypothetical protein